MMSLVKTVKHTSLYGVANAAQKFLGFVLLPFFMEHLTLDDYGFLALLEVSSQLVVGLFGSRMPTAMLRFLSEKRYREFKNTIISQTLFYTMLSSIPLIMVAVFFPQVIEEHFLTGSTLSYVFVYYIFTQIISLFISVYLDLQRYLEKPIPYTALNILRFTLTLVFTIFFVRYYSMGAEGVIVAQAVASFAALIFIFPKLFRYLSIKIDKELLKEMFQYAAPLVLSTMSYLILTLSDRYILPMFHTFESVGSYSVAYKVASLLNILVIQSFSVGFYPIALKEYEKKNLNYFKLSFNSIVIVMFFVSVLITVFFQPFAKMFSFTSSNYLSAAYLIPFILYFFINRGVQVISMMPFHLAKKTMISAQITALVLVLNLVLNFTLIPKFDVLGAVLATVISSLVMTYMGTVKGKEVINLGLSFRKFYILTVLFAGVVIASQLVTSLMFSFLVIILYLLAMHILKIVKISEVKRLLRAHILRK